MSRTFKAIAIAVVLGATTVSVALAGTPAAGQAPDPKKASAGKKLYVTYKCDKCHTIAGRGTKKTDGELDGVGAKLTPVEIKKWLTTPAEMEARAWIRDLGAVGAHRGEQIELFSEIPVATSPKE